MRIVAGTYEGFCYGWESNNSESTAVGAETLSGTTKTDTRGVKNSSPPPCATAASSSHPPPPPQPLSLVFGYNVHVGCMKSVAIATSGSRAGQLLVTGGADERVRIYDLRDRTELGELQQHNGTITCMEFYKSTHLLTGSEDHTVCIWRVHDWALLHVLGGHKAAVTSLSIHPSGRMALSVSRDRTLRLWNLLEGRCAYIKRLQGEGELVKWSPAGDSYLVVVGSTVSVYSAATSEAVGECRHDARVNSACFAGGNGGKGAVAVATCADDKTIRFFRTEGGTLLGKVDVSDVCPTGRIRDMCHVGAASAADGGGGGDGAGSVGGSLATVTSTGGVHVWGVPALEGVGAEGSGAELTVPLLSTHSLKGEPRFTCVTACLSGDVTEPAPGKSKNSKKRKRRQRQQQETTGDGQTRGPPGEEGRGQEGAPGAGGSGSNKKKNKSKRKKTKEVQFQGDATSNGAIGTGGGGRREKGVGVGKKRGAKV
ncbi:unnamed protein product [Ectocarpus sp. 12 AP-2014]